MPLSVQRLVLLVDDDPYIVSVFHRAFEGQGDFMLDIAMTVELAIQKIKVVQYDLIFLDMKLGYNYAGMAVLRELLQQEVVLKAERHLVASSLVVIMSGSINFHDVMKEAHELGVLCFLEKPVAFTEEYVRKILHRLGLPLLPRRSAVQ